MTKIVKKWHWDAFAYFLYTQRSKILNFHYSKNLAKDNFVKKMQGAFMNTEKTNYQCPLTSVVNIGTEGLICFSKTMLFGTEDNTSGVINDENIIDGGSF